MADWTLLDVQKSLHSILLADHPLTQEQRKALQLSIELCTIWERLAPGFKKVISEFKAKGLIPSIPEIR